MPSRWLGLIELFVVFGFVLAYGAVELLALRRERKRQALREAGQGAETPDATGPGAGDDDAPRDRA